MDAAPASAIREASGARDVALARALFDEYAAGLGVDLCFQGFAEELATLPGAYAPPRGALLLAGSPDDAFACVALRPLDAAAGEVKRLYVQPRARGQGWGRRLVDAVIDRARAIGYRELKLDTLGSMTQAQALYASVGFRPCAPYYRNPLGDTIYMSLTLG
jgi:ribosomal protein S18 acetylase RimI-like enzyme